MKKLLSIISAFSLTTSTLSSVVACNTSTTENNTEPEKIYPDFKKFKNIKEFFMMNYENNISSIYGFFNHTSFELLRYEEPESNETLWENQNKRIYHEIYEGLDYLVNNKSPFFDANGTDETKDKYPNNPTGEEINYNFVTYFENSDPEFNPAEPFLKVFHFEIDGNPDPSKFGDNVIKNSTGEKFYYTQLEIIGENRWIEYNKDSSDNKIWIILGERRDEDLEDCFIPTMWMENEQKPEGWEIPEKI